MGDDGGQPPPILGAAFDGFLLCPVKGGIEVLDGEFAEP